MIVMEKLPVKPFTRILKNAGAQRVTRKGAEDFTRWVEELAHEKAKEIVRASLFAKRKTVTEKDVAFVKTGA